MKNSRKRSFGMEIMRGATTRIDGSSSWYEWQFFSSENEHGRQTMTRGGIPFST